MVAPGSRMAWHTWWESFTKKFQASCLPVPVGLEFRVGGVFCLRAGDGDEETLGIGEFRRVFLEITAETAAQEIALVGFFGSPFAGDESGLQ